MKYRRLTRQELIGLEEDFIRFLAANTVTAEDWEKLKEEKPGHAEKLIELFSDIVFDRAFEKAEYLEFRMPRDIKAFRFQEGKVVMNGLRVEGRTDLDFTRDLSPAQMLERLRESKARLQLYTAEKKYRKERSLEMFDMMENGALISRDGSLFSMLEQLKKAE